MNTKTISVVVCSLLAVIGFSFPSRSQARPKNIYTCLQNNSSPATVVDTPRGRIELIVWKSDHFRNSGWTPQKRCVEVTKRFQEFSDNNTLRYVATGRMNKQKVICVAQKKPTGVQCRKDGLLITLQTNDNPLRVLDELFDISSRVSMGGLTRSGGVLDLEDFLQKAPVMSSNVPPVSNPRPRPRPTPTPRPISKPIIIQIIPSTSNTRPPNPSPRPEQPESPPTCPPLLCP